MAVDDKGGISRDGSMPWPKNSSDLKLSLIHILTLPTNREV